MMCGSRATDEDSYASIDRALDAGLNCLDTANVYARGLSEEITGEALRRNGRRQHVVLATKVHGRMADDDVNALGNSRRHIIARSEEHTSELQSPDHLVCRLLLEKKKRLRAPRSSSSSAPWGSVSARPSSTTGTNATRAYVTGGTRRLPRRCGRFFTLRFLCGWVR